MSIQVPLDELAAEVARRGAGYLLTTIPGGRPHVMHVLFQQLDRGAGGTGTGTDRFRVRIGRTAAANITADSAGAVTLLWPPIDGDGEGSSETDSYSLIADATASVEDGGDGPVAVLTPIHGIFHRPAT